MYVEDKRTSDRWVNEFVLCGLAEAIDDYRRDYQRHHEVKVIPQLTLAIPRLILKRLGRVRDGLPDHRAAMLGPEAGQVNEGLDFGRAGLDLAQAIRGLWAFVLVWLKELSESFLTQKFFAEKSD